MEQTPKLQEVLVRNFKNMAKLVRDKRMAHPNGYSQSELSHILGYKNGQFISNVERSLCSIPLKMLKKISQVLDIPTEEIKIAVLKDQEITLDAYLYGGKDDVVKSRRSKAANSSNATTIATPKAA